MEENNNNPDTFVKHIKIIEHNARALSARIESFLSGEEHQFNILSSRLVSHQIIIILKNPEHSLI